jgi:hypothetical protein
VQRVIVDNITRTIIMNFPNKYCEGLRKRNYTVKKRVFIIINQNIQENLFIARPPFGQKIVPIFWLAGKTTARKSFFREFYVNLNPDFFGL